MAHNFMPINREQMYLLPPSLREWVPEDDPVWFVIESVEAMDLSAFYAEYNAEGVGGKAYHPEMMVALLLYAYCQGERSSRRIERLCARDVAYRVASANQQPDHTSVARFRQRHEAALSGVFSEVLKQVKKAGLLRVGVVALDGTKIKANASLSANRTEDGLEAEVRRMLKEAAETDAAEDRLYGDDVPGRLPEGFRTKKDRLERLAAAREEIAREKAEAVKAQEEKLAQREAEEESEGRKKRGRKPKAPEDCAPRDLKANVTDPESRIMKARAGYLQGYNAQVAVTRDQFIVAAELTQDRNDVQQLVGMVGKVRENLAEARVEESVGTVLADAGYWSEANVQGLKPGDPELLVATTKDWKQRKAMREKGAPRGRIPEGLPVRDRMERRLLTKRGKALYALRSQTVEPAIGQLKDVTGLHRFSRRGRSACDSELKFTAAAHNLLKLWRRCAEKGWERGKKGLRTGVRDLLRAIFVHLRAPSAPHPAWTPA